MKRRLLGWSLTVASLLLCLPGAAAAATDMGFANANDGAGVAGYQTYYNSNTYDPTSGFIDFQTEMQAMTDNGYPMRYQRFDVSWDAFGAWNASANSCQTPATPGANNVDLSATALINSIHDAESLGYTPVIALVNDAADDSGMNNGGSVYPSGNVWQPGAEVPTAPGDAQYAW